MHDIYEWNTGKLLGQYLLVIYMDGNIKEEKDSQFERTVHGLPPSPIFTGHTEWLDKEILKARGIILK